MTQRKNYQEAFANHIKTEVIAGIGEGRERNIQNKKGLDLCQKQIQ